MGFRIRLLVRFPRSGERRDPYKTLECTRTVPANNNNKNNPCKKSGIKKTRIVTLCRRVSLRVFFSNAVKEEKIAAEAGGERKKAAGTHSSVLVFCTGREERKGKGLCVSQIEMQC